MACNIRKFKEDKTKAAMDLVFNPLAVTYRKTAANSIAITPKAGSNIKTMNQAFRAAESMEKKIAKEFGKSYRFDVYGKWTTIHKNPSGVRLEINIPTNLLKAYQVKEAKKESEYFATETAAIEQREKTEGNFFDMPNRRVSLDDQINSSEFSKYKERLLRKAQTKILDLKAELKQNYSPETNKKLAKYNKLAEKLETDIIAIKDASNTVGVIELQIRKDLQTLDELLSNDPSLDDLYNAQEILSFYNSITDMKFDSANKFLNYAEAFDLNKEVILDPTIVDMLNHTSREPYRIERRIIYRDC